MDCENVQGTAINSSVAVMNCLAGKRAHLVEDAPPGSATFKGSRVETAARAFYEDMAP
jgi:hypothetical protein